PTPASRRGAGAAWTVFVPPNPPRGQGTSDERRRRLGGPPGGERDNRVSGLRLCVTLLTVIPWRGAGDDAAPGGDTAPPRAAVAAAMAWAPAVGLLLGVVASAVLLLADHPLGAGPLTASVLAVGSLALLSRGLHLDGLADLADGLASGKPAPVM